MLACYALTPFRSPSDQVSPGAVEFLQRVVAAAVRMDSLIQDVLALTNVVRRPVVLTAVDVDTLVRDLVRERPEFAPPGVQLDVRSRLLPVLAHEALLSQCLTNLLANAVKFVEPGAVPRIRVWTEERSRAAEDTTPWVRIWVEDQGIGIPPEAQARILEIFQRLHTNSQYEGSGIGLAIVHKAMERMGGRLGVESQVKRGSRFWLELPKADGG